MKTNYLNDIQEVLNHINKISTLQFKVSFRNGFTYIDDQNNETYFNSARTKRELLTALYAFQKGLQMSSEILKSK